MTNAQHIRNLLNVYDATRPEELEGALENYRRYHDLIEEVASQTGTELRIAVGVFSALSPNNSYVSNLRNCRTLLQAARNGWSIQDFRVNTYDSNKRKAWTMATGEADPLDLFKGLKTRAFFLNILDPEDQEPITVDGHIYWVWMGRKGAVKTRGAEGKRNEAARRASRVPVAAPAVDHGPDLLKVMANPPRPKAIPLCLSRKENAPPHLSPKMYAEISDGIRLVGELRGVIGCQAQAVLWQTWRRLHGVQGANQMQLIAPDVFAAGNHNHRHATKGCGQ